MNCKTVAENMPGIISGELRPTLLADCEQHIDQCPDCRYALRGAKSLALLKERDTSTVPAGLFDRISRGLVTSGNRPSDQRGFWLGTGFGAAVAASILALALTLGWYRPTADPASEVAQFAVALGEPRNINIAIETDRALAGASISILLSGAVELDGFGSRRELTWTTDLEAGVNRLSLPIMAIEPRGGQMVVRLSHPDSEQVFLVRLSTNV